MTDSKFQKLLGTLHNAHYKYQELLKEAEKEYERRFGYCPSDIDDDFWIDGFHINATPSTVERITKEAKNCVLLKENK